MEIEQVLEKVGLSEKEALVYKAVLELGRGSASSIAYRAGVKRPTTYIILDELRKRGLILVMPRAKKNIYIAESPKKLESILQEKEDVLRQSLPELLALYNIKPEKPVIKYYEGKEQIFEIYDEILKAKEVWFFGSVKEIVAIFPEYFEKFNKEAEERGLKIKEIIGTGAEDIEYFKQYSESGRHQIRFLPKESEFIFKTDHAIWGNKIAIFSYQFMFGVVIEGQDVADTYRALFNLAWQSAENKK